MDEVETSAVNFFRSPAGQYLARVVDEEREILRDSLERIDPRRPFGRRKWLKAKEELVALSKVNELLVHLFQVAETRMAEDAHLRDPVDNDG